MDNDLKSAATFFLHYINENDQFVVEYLTSDNKKRMFGAMYGKFKKETQTSLSYYVSVKLFEKLITKIF